MVISDEESCAACCASESSCFNSTRASRSLFRVGASMDALGFESLGFEGFRFEGLRVEGSGVEGKEQE